MSSLLIRNLSQLATPRGRTGIRGPAIRDLTVLERPVIVVTRERFSFVGPESEIPSGIRAVITDDFNAGGATALPAFVDTHTHLPFAGFRESEFNRRLMGESYQQIAASGGGIASTVHATRAASEADLVELVRKRAETMALHGTTTAEAKSGYGLTLGDELKQLRAIREASARSAVRLVPTCLAAHEFPPGCKTASEREDWITEITGEILPAVARAQLASFCDVFIEQGVFTREQGARILSRGAALGMTPRVHADELSDTDGATLAAALGAASADHLMHVSDRGIAALGASNTVANLLPSTSFFLMTGRYAPARALLDAGAIVSLSTDCNPGTSMTESMQIAVQLAALQMKMTVEEALTAATLNGAFSVGLADELGTIEVGKRADLVLLDAPNYLHLVYHFGVNLVRDVLRDGKWIVRKGAVVPELRIEN